MTDAREGLRRQRGALRLARRLTILAAVLGLAYLVMRFEFLRLPEERCSPLVRFAPGDQLVVDGRPSSVSEGDAVLVMTQSGARHLCRVERVRADDGRLWVVSDNPECPGFSSDAAGWIDPRAAVGRVLMSWEH